MSEPFIVRASSWGRLFDCAHAWEGTHILGLKNPAGLRAALGTAIHAGTAVYDQSRIDCSGLSIDDAAGVLVEVLHNPRDETDLRDEDLTIKDAERIGLSLLTRYCAEISPRYTFAAVERETKPLEIDCGCGVIIRLTGTMDRARVRVSGDGSTGKGISDLKSGKTAVQKGVAKTKGHAAQLGTYELLEEHTTGEPCTEPGEIIGLKTGGTPEVATGLIVGAKARMVGDTESPGLIEYAAEMFRSGLFPPNAQSHICGARYCARFETCKFHD